MSERLNKATICSVVSLDILDLSGKPVVQQIRDKEIFNSIIDEAVKDVAQHDRMLIDTGDGKTLVLFGVPEAALFIAMMIRDAVVEHNKVSDDKLFIRAGISIGAAKVIADSNGLPGIQGEGVKAAERIRNLAGPNQILVSRAYYDITSGLTDEIAGMFLPFKGEQDVYSIRSPEEEPFVPESSAELADTAPLISRLLNGENSPRYGLWSSAALVAIVMLVGGFLLISNRLPPDLGVVVADSHPAAPATDLQTVSTPSASAQLSPEAHETGPDSVEPAVSEPIMPAQEPAAKIAATPPAAIQPGPPQGAPGLPDATTVQADAQMDLSGSDVIADTEQAEPEPEVVIEPVVPKEKTKKVAAASSARSGPAVEERSLPSGGRHKTAWDVLRESFKQGRKEHVCTQAEIALNQCK